MWMNWKVRIRVGPRMQSSKAGNSSKVFICKKEAGKLRVMKLAGRLSGQAVTRRIHR